MEYTIRPYNKECDDEFVWNLHLKENLAYIHRHIPGTSMEVVRDWYERSIPAFNGYIVEQSGKRIGCYFLKETQKSIFMRSFFLIDEVQGKGLGSVLFQKMLDDYAATGKCFEIYVWSDNPVQDFWYRKGFEHISTSEEQLMLLRRKPVEA